MHHVVLWALPAGAHSEARTSRPDILVRSSIAKLVSTAQKTDAFYLELVSVTGGGNGATTEPNLRRLLSSVSTTGSGWRRLRHIISAHAELFSLHMNFNMQMEEGKKNTFSLCLLFFSFWHLCCQEINLENLNSNPSLEEGREVCLNVVSLRGFWRGLFRHQRDWTHWVKTSEILHLCDFRCLWQTGRERWSTLHVYTQKSDRAAAMFPTSVGFISRPSDHTTEAIINKLTAASPLSRRTQSQPKSARLHPLQYSNMKLGSSSQQDVTMETTVL